MLDTNSGYDYWGHDTKDTKYSETQEVLRDIVFEMMIDRSYNHSPVVS